jgi:hypothetical protein
MEFQLPDSPESLSGFAGFVLADECADIGRAANEQEAGGLLPARLFDSARMTGL